MNTSEYVDKKDSRLSHWMSLLRLPNLFTVPGGPVAGFWLSGCSLLIPDMPLKLGAIAGSSLCLYSAGLILNDLFDIETDTIERPSRPLPSSKVSRKAAITVVLILDSVAIGLALYAGIPSLIVAVIIAVLVLLYNGAARKIPVIGFLVMGLCRGGNILLGATLTDSINLPPVIAAMALTGYIIALTALAEFETKKIPGIALRWLPPVVLTLGMMSLVVYIGFSTVSIITALIPIIAVVAVSASIKSDMSIDTIPPKIGKLVRAIIPVQAAFIMTGKDALSGAHYFAIVLYAMWILSHVAGKKFHGS